MGLVTNETVGTSITIENGKADVKVAENTPVSITSNGLVLNVAQRDTNIIKVEQGDNGAQLFAQIFDGEFKHPEFDPATQELVTESVDMKIAGSDLYMTAVRETVVDKKPTIKFAEYDYLGKKMYVVVDRMRLSVSELKKLITRKVDYKVEIPGVVLGERDVALAYSQDEPSYQVDIAADGAVDGTAVYRDTELRYDETTDMFIAGTRDERGTRIVTIKATVGTSTYDYANNRIVTPVTFTSNTPRIPAVLFDSVELSTGGEAVPVIDGDNITGVNILTPADACADTGDISGVVKFELGIKNNVNATYRRDPRAVVLAGLADENTAYAAIRLGDGVAEDDITLADGWAWTDIDRRGLATEVRNDPHVHIAEFSGEISTQSVDIKGVLVGTCKQDVHNTWIDSLYNSDLFSGKTTHGMTGARDVELVFGVSAANQL